MSKWLKRHLLLTTNQALKCQSILQKRLQKRLRELSKRRDRLKNLLIQKENLAKPNPRKRKWNHPHPKNCLVKRKRNLNTNRTLDFQNVVCRRCFQPRTRRKLSLRKSHSMTHMMQKRIPMDISTCSSKRIISCIQQWRINSKRFARMKKSQTQYLRLRIGKVLLDSEPLSRTTLRNSGLRERQVLSTCASKMATVPPLNLWYLFSATKETQWLYQVPATLHFLPIFT